MRFALAAALLLAPALAPAIELTGHLGFSYLRTDSWVERAAHEALPRLDLDIGAAARGTVVSPEYALWQLDVAWHRLSQSMSGERNTVNNSLYYGGRVSLFNSLRSPVGLSFDGSRSFTTFSSTSATSVTGETVTQSYGTQVTFSPAVLPPVTLGYRWNDYQTTVQGDAPRTRSVQLLNGGTSLGTSAFKLNANYNGELSDGSWTTDRYDTHRVSLSVRAPLSQRFELFLDEQYLLTDPASLQATGAQKLDNNYFRAFASNAGSYGDRHVVSYSSGHLLSEPAGGPISEQTRQALRYEGDLLLTSPTLFTRWMLDASINQTRAGATSLDTSGETLGVQLWWRRQGERSLYEVWGGPVVGFVQSTAAGDSTGYGAAAAARANQPLWDQDTTLTYRLDWANDLYGAKGSSLRQALDASMSGGLASGRYLVTASAGSTRTSSPILGDGANRSLALQLNTTFRDLVAEGSVTLQQGVEGATPKDFVSDGLFIPAPFDARTVQTYLRGTYQLFYGLSATGQVRWLNATHPGHPAVDQSEVLAGLSYRYGAFVLAVEDRYGWNDSTTGSYQVNQFMFRIFRQIGWGR